ncbi:hypothetical protein L218DRAFT_624754 [Marasmius fiardii PR-910]|nr:hypothetical protein L218DRAFT_624754 [Marasmius fiardii PR-910]
MAGSELYGSPAFRPTLVELRNYLPKSIWQVFSATAPPHVMSTIERSFLKPDYKMLQYSLNRANLIYAIHCVVKSLSVLENYECFLTKPFDFDQQPSVLPFFDSSELAKAVANHLEGLLPPSWQGRGVVKHYHSMMSVKVRTRILLIRKRRGRFYVQRQLKPRVLISGASSLLFTVICSVYLKPYIPHTYVSRQE